jgi:hypothetical protein
MFVRTAEAVYVAAPEIIEEQAGAFPHSLAYPLPDAVIP